MTADEYQHQRERLIRGYAAENVTAGNWPAQDAEARSAEVTDRLLPDGERTAGMLLLVAETPDGQPVGSVWVALQSSNADGAAWIYDIEVDSGQRGRGYGRALLEAAERESAAHGARAIGLNVFGGNTVARSLYDSAGYAVTTQQMRKDLTS
jgi:ribosomal protein S18 acetylase RimI-like enzyme